MADRELWSAMEVDLLGKYFTGPMTEMTLYQKIQAINPARTYEAMTRKIRRMREEGWTRVRDDALNRLRVGYLDIEATNLNADFGIILTWYIKKDSRNEYDYSIITREEILDYTFDRRVVSELLDALDNYDVIWTHYGSDWRFDVPFIRARAFALGLEHKLPKRMEKLLKDTYPIARSKLKIHSNRLGSIANALNIRNIKKTPLNPEKWRLAAYGDPKALECIAIHNKRDVQLLERVQKKLSLVDRSGYRGM